MAGSYIGSATPHERVQNYVPSEGKHADQALGEGYGIRSRVLPGRGSTHRPNLLKPFAVARFRNHRQNPGCQRGFTITPRLSLKENVLYVVLYNTVGFVRFAQEPGPIFYLKLGIGNLGPNNWR
jgi:hypothetical protein